MEFIKTAQTVLTTWIMDTFNSLIPVYAHAVCAPNAAAELDEKANRYLMCEDSSPRTASSMSNTGLFENSQP
jgi:hypothetical protein